ncbi:MAG: hypothetical protein V3U54_13090 [Thermodesulfobacteriota bacterium]
MSFFESVLYNFLFFTVVYILVEFNVPYERWRGKYWLFLNPFHFIWSEVGITKHEQFAMDGRDTTLFLQQIQMKVENEYPKTYEVPYDNEVLDWWKNALRMSEVIVYPNFWRRFSIDIIAHLVINLIFAWELARAPNLWFMVVFWLMIGIGYIYYSYREKRGKPNSSTSLPKMYQAYRLTKWFKW